MKQTWIFALTIITSIPVFAQNTTTEEPKKLMEVNINRISRQREIRRLDSVSGTYIFSGKKSEVIDLTNKDVGLAEKYGRQVFSKIPGIFVYDMDGTGNQTNISTRGLDPHRGWEFNIRKDGILTNSDMYGYPASHYNIPLEAVERIELVRGTGSLQYGGQFGGMLNYVSKKPDSSQLSFQSVNTVGSYGLLSTFNSLSGTKGKFKYYAWFNKKASSGYRKNSDSKYGAQNISLFYEFTPNLEFKAEWTRSDYVTHLAGQLTDQMFKDDPRSSTRSRNYYNPDINVPSITLDWKAGENTQLKFTSSAVIGARNSVLFDKLVNVVDAIDPVNLQYANRQVDVDHFNSYTSELRLLHSYRFLGQISNLTAGIQYMNNDLHRQQLGKGTTGADFDLSLVTPGWGRDMHLKTSNVALFAENRWVVSPKFSVNAGLRVEAGETNMTGVINNYPTEDIPNTIKHEYPLFGAGAQYELNKTMNLYAGWSQAYRPVIFKDIVPGSIFEIVDKKLKDAKGYNLEGGFRGNWKFLNWDVSYFQLQYNNRLGTVSQTDGDNQETIYRTNIGDSKTRGVEIFIQAAFPLGKMTSLSLFTATAYMDAQYQKASIRDANAKSTVSVDGNKVESVPEWTSRNGATLKIKHNSLSILHSYTAKSFADALNAVMPNATGSVGIVPSYNLFDMNASIAMTGYLRIGLNVGNVFDKEYFTKRPQFYPGPGIWPSDGRMYSTSVSLSL
ncbi:TonB-dependent receptor family protein [Pedobacter psychroterrae]|uniref:TonB-dependent receptor n=1 Tax=Pedobacter psychroterrae TaxID=2530453 RepID=A0A4R0NIQ7_9SPHI|nr:TonB-dependent receptor [Pedobacter psychroterrae]TCD00376.1 TonB-dependent receptor [Pedobacter psychroterrae]